MGKEARKASRCGEAGFHCRLLKAVFIGASGLVVVPGPEECICCA